MFARRNESNHCCAAQLPHRAEAKYVFISLTEYTDDRLFLQEVVEYSSILCGKFL